MISIQALYDYKTGGATTISRTDFISIQALYDYKMDQWGYVYQPPVFQFKHCTIIRANPNSGVQLCGISIQALYDYKAEL